MPVCTIPLGENGENAEWIIMLDHDDYEVDLQNRYQDENAANGTDKSPQSVGNRKKKILERLKKLIEKAEQ